MELHEATKSVQTRTAPSVSTETSDAAGLRAAHHRLVAKNRPTGQTIERSRVVGFFVERANFVLSRLRSDFNLASVFSANGRPLRAPARHWFPSPCTVPALHDTSLLVFFGLRSLVGCQLRLMPGWMPHGSGRASATAIPPAMCTHESSLAVCNARELLSGLLRDLQALIAMLCCRFMGCREQGHVQQHARALGHSRFVMLASGAFHCMV